MQRPAAFAIPGDIETLTGGYIYERRLLEGLRALGRDVDRMSCWETAFPTPRPGTSPTPSRRSRPSSPGGCSFSTVSSWARSRPRASPGLRAPVGGDGPPPSCARKRPRRGAPGSLPTEPTGASLPDRAANNLALAAQSSCRAPTPRKFSPRDTACRPRRITIARAGHRPGRRRARAGRSAAHPRGRHPARAQGARHSPEGLARLRARDWQAVVVGARHDERHAAALDRLHGDLGLGGRVRMAGQVSGRGTRRALSRGLRLRARHTLRGLRQSRSTRR